ncbi:hypothetical protein PTTG_02913 [Puccinia triticina 1-1 BBBD Race 1]|uniref:MULE transposase domain-containing protein n=1 Tax=Puccinia triticina (isolate 1-1 / race 1 (BBBD)) TaxID=630390 RepID=A0A0C4EQ58_PUCT1|nr:hypothetical protein PTTG_02913 [Puccinia triticina 1-1 BBBD Race 1]
MAVLARRDLNPFRSISLWNDNLTEQGWNTFLPASQDLADFVFAFQSPWQKDQMLEHGRAMIMLDNPVVGKGLLICWAFTASAATNGLRSVYSDLRKRAPKMYWCIFHVLKALKLRAQFYLPEQFKEAIADFRSILYEQLDPKGKLQLFYGKWLTVSTSFVEYVQNQWDVNIIHWALAY